MIAVTSEGDKVILDLCGRKRDVLLSPLDAERLADALEEAAARAERELPELIHGEPWGVQVTNFDRRVVLRFSTPDGLTPERVPFPVVAARRVADMLRTNANFAGNGLRLTMRGI